MPKIFISYRREDSAGFAGRLSDALEARYGAGNVFRDVEDIQAGDDFVHALSAQMAGCDVVIALIGNRWLGPRSGGSRRIDEPDDTLRMEIRTALEQDRRLIPALVDGALMPAAKELPTDIEALSRRQAVVLNDRSWTSDVDALARAIGEPDAAPEPAATTAPAGATTQPTATARMTHGAVLRARRRGFFAVLLMLSLAAGAGAAWYLSRFPDLGGDWQFDDGSRWRVQQKGRNLHIDELHYQTRQIWRSGTAAIRDRDVDVELTYIFQPGVSLKGTLRLSDDGRTMSGVLTELPSERRFALSVHR